MGFVLLFVASIVLGLPILALVLAIVALQKSQDLQKKLTALRAQLEVLTREVRRGAGAAAPEAAEEAHEAPAAPPAAPVATRPTAAAPAPVTPRAAEAPPPPPDAALRTSPAAEQWPPLRAAPPEVAGAQRRWFEEFVGARLFVWIGAAALALAAALFMKEAFQRGWISPAMRVALGILFGVALLILAEFIRRRAARVAQGLSAAGIAALYASLLAGVTLYDLYPRWVGFTGMALTTATAVALSLRHGLLIAVLGLLGGFLTPALIRAEEPHAAALFGYLLLLQIGLVVAAHVRRWWPIAALALVGGAAWVTIWIAAQLRPGDSIAVGLFVLASVAVFGFASWRRRAELAGGDRTINTSLAVAGAVLGVALLAYLAGASHYGAVEWSFLLVLAFGALVLGRLDPGFEFTAWFASAAGLVLLFCWGAQTGPPLRLAWTALGYGGVIAAGAYVALWSSENPVRWAALSAGTAVFYFLAAWWQLRRMQDGPPWGVLSLFFAAIFVAAAYPVAQRRLRAAQLSPALAALAAAATTFASAAAPLELSRFTLTAVWALEIPALAWIEARLKVRELRILAGALGAMVLTRLLLNPWVLGYPVGDAPIVNWVLYGYGLPAAALVLAGWLYRREPNGILSREVCESGAVLLGLALIALEVRHYFHAVAPRPVELARPLLEGKFQVAEWGAIVALWLLFGWLLFWLAGRWPRRSLLWGGRAVVGLALLAGLYTLGLVGDPLVVDLPVGAARVFNALLFAYGIPALLMLVVAWWLKRRDEPWLAPAAGLTSLVLWFLLITTEIRQAFHGSRLTEGPTTNPELYTYSAAWVVFGVVLLVVGIVTRGMIARWASLAVMILAVGKVFLIDLAQLEGMYRVLSLLGAGASLLLLAFLYQQFVFRREGR